MVEQPGSAKPSGLDHGFAPELSGWIGGATVHAMAIQTDGKIAVSGSFVSINRHPSSFIGRINPDGTTDTSFVSAGAQHRFGLAKIATLLAQNDGKLLVGGEFDFVEGVLRRNLARLHVDGSLDHSFEPNEGPNGPVATIIINNDGRILIGGAFTTVNGTPRSRVARLHVDGTLDESFDPSEHPEGIATALAVQSDGKVLVGGQFVRFDGQRRTSLVRLNADGRLDTGFDALLGTNATIFALQIQSDGKIIVGGTFDRVQGMPRQSIARLQADGGLDSSFAPVLVNTRGPPVVRAVLVQSDNHAVIGGDFTHINGEPRGHLARLEVNGGIDAAFAPNLGVANNLTPAVFALAPYYRDQVLVAGQFTNVSGFERTGLARLQFDQENASSPTVASNPISQEVGEGGVVHLSSVSAGSSPISVRWQFNGMNLPGATNAVLKLSRITGTQGGRYRLVASNAMGSAQSAEATLTVKAANALPGMPVIDFAPDLQARSSEGVGRIIKQPDGKFLVAGTFSSVEGEARNGLARLLVDGTLDRSFVPATGIGRVIYALQPDGKILTAGPASPVRLNADGTRDGTFNISTGISWNFSYVAAIAVQDDGKMVVGGSFMKFNGIDHAKVIVRLNADGTIDADFNPRIELAFNPVYVLALLLQPDGRIVVGGIFSKVNGVPRWNIARLNADGTLDLSFDPGSGVGGYVAWGDFGEFPSRLALQTDGKILVGGNFTEVNGVTRLRLARLHADGSLDLMFSPQVGYGLSLERVNPALVQSERVSALEVQSDGKVIVGGDFTTLNGVPRNHLGRLYPDGTLDEGFQTGSGFDAPVATIALLAEDAVLVGGGFTRINGLVRPRIARLHAGAAPSGKPQITVHPTDRIVSRGEHVSFVVSAISGSPIRYQWQQNGLDLPGATNSILSLTHTTVGDAAVYRIIVRNETGPVISDPARLIVVVPPIYPGSVDDQFIPESTFTTEGHPINAIALQPDGKAIVGGYVIDPSGRAFNGVARLNPDGSFDPLFGGQTRIGGEPLLRSNSFINAIALQRDGRIIIAGYLDAMGGGPRRLIARLHADGRLDETFDPGTNSGWSGVKDILIQNDDKIVVGPERLRSDGTRDDSFKVTVRENSSPGTIHSAALQPDGKIIFAGHFHTINGVPRDGFARVHPDGSLDQEFRGVNMRIHEMAVQSDGKIIVYGIIYDWFEGPLGLFIYRLLSDGSVDAQFKPPMLQSKEAFNPIGTVAFQPDGKIILGGLFTALNNQSRHNLARLNQDGSLDSSFQSGAGVGGDFTSRESHVKAIAILPDGKVMIGGHFARIGDVPRSGIARLHGDPFLFGVDFVDPGAFGISVLTSRGKEYILEFKGSLADATWAALPPVPGDDTVKTLTDMNPGSRQRFYRLRIE